MTRIQIKRLKEQALGLSFMTALIIAMLAGVVYLGSFMPTATPQQIQVITWSICALLALVLVPMYTMVLLLEKVFK